jgi:uncharacterized protein
MKILFYLGHPAHFHLFKNSIKILMSENEVYIVAKEKDILINLIKNENWTYYNILDKKRKNHNKLSIAFELLIREVKLFNFCIKNKPNIMIGTSAEITHIGKLLNIPSIVTNEDDIDQVPFFAKIAYPFATKILAPKSCDVGRWEYKTIKYNGYQELAYLHPNNFKPDINKIKNTLNISEPFFILRFAKLNAHHDKGKNGITDNIAMKIIKILEPFGNIYITSERKLENKFEKYKIQIDPNDIHHALFFASLYIGDSQTMAAEAAILGTPSIRYNDFVGKLGYLNELETKYSLTYGIDTNNTKKLFDTIHYYIQYINNKKAYSEFKNIMLKECIDTNELIVDTINSFINKKNI